MRIVTPLFVSLLLCGIPAVACSATDPSTDDEKSFYALGLIISQSLSPFALTESELNLVKTGMTDGVLKKTPKVDLQTYGPKVNQIQQTRVAAVADNEKKAGATFSKKPPRSTVPRKPNPAPSSPPSKKVQASSRRPPTRSKSITTARSSMAPYSIVQ